MKKNKRPQTFVQTYHIGAKYSAEVLFPSNAVDAAFWAHEEGVIPRFLTSDGVLCEPKFIRTINNGGGRYDGELEDLCRLHFGVSFVYLRSVWVSRLGALDNYWHLITLTKI